MKIYIPAFVPMAKCNEHLAHGPIDIDLGPDVVQVVRCKDCKHRTDATDSGNYLCNRKTLGLVRPNDFCSFGERKDGEG